MKDCYSDRECEDTLRQSCIGMARRLEDLCHIHGDAVGGIREVNVEMEGISMMGMKAG